MSNSDSTLKQKVYRGIREYLIITAYLWLVFALFDIYKAILVKQYNIDLVAKSFAVINALALAKIALVARELKLDEYLRPKGSPLIYPSLINAAGFSALLAIFKMLEDGLVGLYHGRSFWESVVELGGGNWLGLLCISAIFFVMLIPFCAFTELGIALGQGKLVRYFFQSHPDSDVKAVSRA